MTEPINLTLNPHYSKSFRFFFLSFIGLFLCGCYLVQSHSLLSNRWDKEIIISVHLFTLGFLLPIFLGSITQLLPVLFGIENNFLNIFNRLIFIAPIAIGLFVYFFHRNDLILNFILMISLAVFWLNLFQLSIIIVKKTITKYQENKKAMYIHLSYSLIYFFLGLVASIWLMLVHFGFSLPIFRPNITDTHLTLFILGFFYHLFVAISQHIIPMFFITNPVSEKIIKRQLTMPIFLFLYFCTFTWPSIHILSKLGIAYLITEYLLQLYLNLKKRRRRGSEPTIMLWNSFFLHCLIGIAIWVILPYSDEYVSNLELALGSAIFIGALLNLIMAMLLKIIPFLIWQNLSQKQMELMNFSIALPTLKDFIKDLDIKIIFSLTVLLSLSALLQFYLTTGLAFIALSLFLGYLTINSLKLQQNFLIQISDHHSNVTE